MLQVISVRFIAKQNEWILHRLLGFSHILFEEPKKLKSFMQEPLKTVNKTRRRYLIWLYIY